MQPNDAFWVNLGNRPDEEVVAVVVVLSDRIVCILQVSEAERKILSQLSRFFGSAAPCWTSFHRDLGRPVVVVFFLLLFWKASRVLVALCAERL